MYRQPQRPAIVIGPIQRSYKLFSCMSSSRTMLLNFQQVKICRSQSAHDQQNPLQQIPLQDVQQISSYRKGQYYFLRILTKQGEKIDCKFVHKEICKEWVYYFHKAIDYLEYLQEKKSYSSQDSYSKFIKNLGDKNKAKIVKLKDSENGINCVYGINASFRHDNSSQQSDKNNSKSTNNLRQRDSPSNASSLHSSHTNSSRQKRSLNSPKNTYQQSNIVIKSNQNLKIIRLADFKITHQIGKGAFSSVYKAEQGGKVYALKQISKDKLIHENQLKYALTQLNILKKCSNASKNKCPFIIPLSYAFQTQDYLYLAIKYLPFGTLKTIIQKRKKFTVKQSISILTELVVAIQYLHKNNILYRDMKPENILMTQQGHIYLIDFGLSIELNDNQEFAESFVGTPLYLAPERLEGSGKINYKADIYGVGCIFYLMLHGHAPFQAQSLASIIYNIKNNELKIRQDLNNDLAQDFLRKTLQTNVDKRLTYMSSHPLFQKVDWNKVSSKDTQIMALEPMAVGFCKAETTGDRDYTEDNYPNKKINDWNYYGQEGQSKAKGG